MLKHLLIIVSLCCAWHAEARSVGRPHLDEEAKSFLREISGGSYGVLVLEVVLFVLLTLFTLTWVYERWSRK